MKVRITRKLSGSVDGIDLGRYRPGFAYEVGPVVGTYLLAIHAAIPAEDHTPALRLPPGAYLFGPPPIADRRARPRKHATDRRQRAALAGLVIADWHRNH